MAEGTPMPSEDEDFDLRADQAEKRVVNMAPGRVMNDVAKPAPAVEPEPVVVTESDRPKTAPELPVEPTSAPAAPESTPIPKTPAPDQSVALTEVPKAKSVKPLGHYVLEALLLIVLITVSLYAFTLHKDRQNLKAQVSSLQTNPQAIIQKQTDDLLARVGTHVSLPTGETPTIALVSDAAAAKQQSAFFKDAQNGDKVLMYVKAGQAILYRPSTDTVILVAPLTFNNPAATSTSAGATTPKR